jgi:hypothetical protein
MNKHERDGSGKAKPGGSGDGPAGLQLYPESPQQRKEWEMEVLESMVIPAVFDDVMLLGTSGPFNEDYSLVGVQSSGKWGLMDLEGEWVLDPQFSEIKPSVGCSVIIRDENGKHGVFDLEKRDWILEPAVEGEKVFSDGLVIDVDHKHGALDRKKGGLLVEPSFDYVRSYGTHEGRIYVCEQGEKTGIKNEQGEWIVEPGFAKMFLPDPYSKLISAKTGDKWGVIDRKGNWVIEPDYQDAKVWKGFSFLKKNGKWGVKGGESGWLIEPEYEDGIELLKSGIFKAASGDGVKLFNTEGEMLGDCAFDAIGYFFDGLAEASKQGKWGVIDEKGQWVIQPLFDELAFFHKGLTGASSGGKWGLIDGKGNWLIEPLFEEVKPVHDGDEGICAMVGKGGKRGLINDKGEWILEPVFDTIDSYWHCGCLLVSKDGKYNFLDKNGRFLSDSGFEKAFVFEQGLALVRVDGEKWGVMNTYGDWVVKPVFELLPPEIDEEDPEYEDIINDMHPADLRSEIKSIRPSDLAEGPLFEECGAFGMSVVPVKVGDRYGFIDCDNKWAVKPVLEDYRKNLWVDHVPVKINGKWGCVYFPRPAFEYDLDFQDKVQKKWDLRAAEKGNAEAMYRVGLECSIWEESDDEALRWFLKAARMGHKKAMEEIADLYEYGGEEVKRKIEEAGMSFPEGGG